MRIAALVTPALNQTPAGLPSRIGISANILPPTLKTGLSPKGCSWVTPGSAQAMGFDVGIAHRAQPSGSGGRCSAARAPLAVHRLDLAGDEADRHGQHRCIVGEAEAGDEIGNDVGGHHEIGQRRKQNAFDAAGRRRIDGAEIGRRRVFGEGDAAGEFGKLLPEAALDRAPVLRDHGGKLEPRTLGGLSGRFVAMTPISGLRRAD